MFVRLVRKNVMGSTKNGTFVLIQQSCECGDCNQCCSSSPQQVLDWIPFRSSHLAKSLQVFLLCEMLGIVTTSAVDDKIIWIGEDLNGPFRTSTVKEYTDELVRDHADDCKKRGKEDEEVDRDYVRKKRVIGRVNSLVTVYRGGPKIAYSVEVLKKNLIPDSEEGQAIVGPDATDQDNTLKEVEKEEEDKSEEEQVEIQAEDINVNDVLCGKGSSISTRPGNQTFLKLAREKKNEYQSAEKNNDKARIVAEVYS